MFVSASRLPHVLPPEAYSSLAHFERECAALLLPAWHVVCTTSDVHRPGDFVTCNLLGHPLQVRNFDGELRAVSNVCAHRHCLISSLTRGSSSRMRCQYHGWEYDKEGRTGHIPSPKNFVPFEEGRERLPLYRLEVCGQLVFVCVQPEGPSLADQLGTLYPVCQERFNAEWSETLNWNPDYPVNWKIPIENSLEAYHVPCIHPRTFEEDPGDERSTHLLEERHTAFGTQLPFSPHSRMAEWFQSTEGWLVRRLGVVPTREYWQHHAFPNLLFSFTDAVSLCHCVIPTSPTSARAVVRQFGRVGAPGTGPRRWLAHHWGRLSAQVTRRIMHEDLGLFPEIQAGLRHSPHAGVLGRCEERIHSFQQFVQEQCLAHEPARGDTARLAAPELAADCECSQALFAGNTP